MSLGYHVIQFIPDPFVDTRISIGALVHDGSKWEFRVSPDGEGVLPRCLGPKAISLYRSLLEDLKTLDAPRLPITLGPAIVIKPLLEIPVGVPDPLTWVQRLLGYPPRPR